jgi:PAS domain S-box-containing protein
MKDDLGSALHTLPGLVWTTLPDGHVDFLSESWREFTGLSIDDLLRTGWCAASHPEDVPKLIAWWKPGLSVAEPRTMEARLRSRDGEYRWFVFRMRAVVDAFGSVTKWCGLGFDIEYQRQSAVLLGPRHEQHRNVTDTIPALMTFLTPAGEIEDVNRHYLEYVGADATPQTLNGWKTSDLVHQDDLRFVTSAWERAIATGETYEIEHRIRRADGVYRWFHVRGLPLRDARGDIVRWYVLQTDIDDRKRAEALLASEKRLLEMVAGRQSLSEILEVLCQLAEDTMDDCYCSILLVDPTGNKFEEAIAPSLAAEFNEAARGWSLQDRGGPCVTAAREKIQVIMSDVATDTRWRNGWRDLAKRHGLISCWSTPIVSLTGKTLGTFALYYNEPRSPTVEHQSLIERFTHIASIAIERSQSDAALKRSEARKTAILNSAIDCIITIDHEGSITEFNPAAERTFGYRRNAVIGKQLAEVIVPPSMREKHQLGLARHLATGESRLIGKRLETVAVRADGSEFPVELTISRIPLDGPPSFTGYLRDIMERKQWEEELRQSEAFLSEGQRLSRTGSFSWCLATGDIMWSDQVYRIFEFDQAVPVTVELIATRVHPDDMHLLRDMMARANSAADGFEYEHRLQMPDHSVKYLHLVAHATRNQHDQLEYIGAVQDITKRHLAEMALGEVRSELAHVVRVASLGALTASIAHEVNQPLSGILTNASTCLRMLAAEPPNVEGARETARRTIRDGNRASDVIVRLRALFGKRKFVFESVDVSEAAQEVIALLLGELQKDRVYIQTEFANELPLVMGDRVQLQQVILNLIRNASDAMRDVEDRPRKLVVRTERDPDDQVRVTVQDAGAGFNPQDTNRLFDAFYTTKAGGMGIGLSVSRSIVENHRGRLWVTPNETHGVSFSFSIPLGLESDHNQETSTSRNTSDKKLSMRGV